MNIPQELIKEAKENLGVKAAEIIASGLSIKRWDARNLKGCCPIHNEKTPSFTWNKRDSYFKCFGCGQTMDILGYYINYRNMSFLDAMKELFKESNTHFDFDEYMPKKNKPYIYPSAEKHPERARVEAYMETRGISKRTLDARGVKEDSKGNIVFEYRDQFGTLMTVKYRPSKKVAKGETKTWCQPGKDTSPLLFGMDRIDVTKPLLICEGEIDSLAAIEAGFTNSVSVPFGANNYKWIEHNFEWLEQFEKIIIWSDSDEAGERMRNEAVPRLGEYRCYVVTSPHKDLNLHLYNEGKESVLRAIENAEEVPIKDVVDLADVPDFDINKAEKIQSGFASLDKWIGGFVLGTVNIITGYNSSGKSTLINQMCVAETLEQGYNVFIFSGELNRSQLRSWIQFPLAGPDYALEYDNGPTQPKGYYVPREVKTAMNEWYRRRVHVYCNEDDLRASSLLRKMEELAKRYGTKVFVLDNLMMIDLECGEYELNKKQKEFVLSLKTFARKFNAVIHLIAHPRKTEAIRRLTKMDVSGSGDITNLADYVISIHRVTLEEKQDKLTPRGEVIVPACPFDNIIDLFKNRPLGHQDKTIGLQFDYPSKRLYGSSDNLYKKYSWTKSWQPKLKGAVEVEEKCPWD